MRSPRAAADESDERVAEEAADVLYHLAVLLRSRDVPHRAASWRRSMASPCAAEPTRAVAPVVERFDRRHARPRSPRSSSSAPRSTAPPTCSSRPSRAGSAATRSSASRRTATLRWALGDEGDPYAARRASSSTASTSRRCDDAPPFAGGAVGFFGYDLVRTVEPLGDPNPDPLGLPDLALMVCELMLAFDHQRHEVSVSPSRSARAATPASSSRERARRSRSRSARAPMTGTRADDRRFESNLTREAVRGERRRGSSTTSTRATRSRSSRRSGSPRPCRSRRSRSTAACAPSTRRRTCTSWTSRTSSSPAPRPSRSSR